MDPSGSKSTHESRVNDYRNGHSGTSNGLNGIMDRHSNHENGTSSFKGGLKQSEYVPVAICGMGLRLPKGIHSDAALYEFLINKGDARSLVGNSRYNSDAYYRPDARPGSVISEYGYFLDDVDLSKFDLSMFSMSPAEVERLDPNQRLLLEVVREALESSGEVDWRGQKIGTYVGVFSEDWKDLHSKDTQDFAPYQLTGEDDFVWANRIAYEYDFKGPRYGCNSTPTSPAKSQG